VLVTIVVSERKVDSEQHGLIDVPRPWGLPLHDAGARTKVCRRSMGCRGAWCAPAVAPAQLLV